MGRGLKKSNLPSRRWPLAGLLALLALAPEAVRSDDWTQPGLSDGRARTSSETSGGLFSQSSWQYAPTATRAVGSPVAADGYVVYGTYDKKIRAVRAVEGTLAWQYTATSEVVASLAVHQGRVIATSSDGNVFALRLSDGALLWQTPLGGLGNSSPTVVGTTVVLGSGFPNKKVVRLNIADGSVAWQTTGGTITDLVNSSLAVSGSDGVIGTVGGQFYKLNLSTGGVTALHNAGGNVGFSSPLISGGVAYLLPGGTSSNLTAVSVATGAVQAGWPLAIADPVAAPGDAIGGETRYAVSSPMQVGTRIVFQIRYDYARDTNADTFRDAFTLREYVVAVDPAGPSVDWQVANGSLNTVNANDVPELGMCPTPAGFGVSGGYRVAVASTLQATLRVLDPSAAGAETWNSATSAATLSSPFLANGRLFVVGGTGTLHAFLSSVNQPPAAPAPVDPASGVDLTGVQPVFAWTLGADPEAQAQTTTIRVDTDGEVLEDWAEELTTAANATSASLVSTLSSNVLYTYSLRARDALGAWSAWTTPLGFSIDMRPEPPSALAAEAAHQRVALSWTASPTPDVVGYNVRYSDGITTTGPTLLANVTANTVLGLTNGTAYTFDVRARDGDGHESDPVTVVATPYPDISIGGTGYFSLAAAIAAAQEGDTVQLGAGTYTLTATLSIREGVSLRGLSAHETHLDATGLAAGLAIVSDLDGGATTISLLSVFGAAIGIHVQDAQDVVLRNLLLRDNTQSGLELGGSATATAVNLTAVENGYGIRVSGVLSVRSSIIVDNLVGLSATVSGTVSSRYNNVADNQTLDYENVGRGPGDLSERIAFVNASNNDFRVTQGQVTNDSGDPQDDFSQEPSPNGGRVDMGAFGNTAFAAAASGGSVGSSDSSSSSCSATAAAPGSTLTLLWPLGTFVLGLAFCLPRNRRGTRRER